MTEHDRPHRRLGVLGRADLLESLHIESRDWFALPGQGGDAFGYQRQQASPRLVLDQQALETDQAPTVAHQSGPLRMESCWAITESRDDHQTQAADEDAIEPPPITEPEPRASLARSDEAADFWTFNAMRRIWPRRHPALRNMVSPHRAKRMAAVNWPEVTRKIARGQSFSPLPRRSRLRWPGNLVLVLDFKSRSMAPLAGDMIGIEDRLRRIIGDRAVDTRILHSQDEASFRFWQPLKEPRKRVPWRPLFGELMLVVSDLASAPRDQHRRIAFSDWLHRMAHGGSEILVLSPIQPPAETLPVSVRVTGWSSNRPDSSSLASATESQELKHLLALVAMIGWVSDVLLRALAEIVKPGAPRLGLIWSAWNHPDMITTPRHCWLSERGVDRYRVFLDGLPVDQIREANEIRRLLLAPLSIGNEHLTVLRMERLAPKLCEIDGFEHARAAAVSWLGNELPQQWNLSSSVDRHELVDLIARIIEIAHPSVRRAHRGAFRRLQRLAMHDALARGESVKSYPELGMIKPDSGDSGGPVQHWKLLRSSDRIRFVPADSGEPGLVMADALSAPATDHAVVEVNGQSRWLEISEAGSQWIRLPDDAKSMLLRLGDHTIQIDQRQRPPWATGWAYTEAGLRARIATPWATEVELPWPCPVDFQVKESHGQIESAFGCDEFGLYADLNIKNVTQRFRWIEPGEFWMGSPEDEPGRFGDEGPQHLVRLSEGFWLADSACTQALWLEVMGSKNPSHFKDNPQCPVEQVSWNDVQGFLRELRKHIPAGAEPLLPTEAQWEYACRAGTTTPFNLGDNITPEQVNYDGNHPYPGAAKGEYRRRTVPVRSLPPNAWGLYEMHGNVWEWCADGRRDYQVMPGGEAIVDPKGPVGASLRVLRVLRGGSWIFNASLARSARRLADVRDYCHYSAGFRLALRSTNTGPAGPEDRE